MEHNELPNKDWTEESSSELSEKKIRKKHLTEEELQTQRQLFIKFCDNCSKSIGLIIKEGLPVIKRLVHKNSGKEEEAIHLLHDALIEMGKYCKKADFQLTTNIVGLLYGICKNLWLKKLGKKKQSTVTFVDLLEYKGIQERIRLEKAQETETEMTATILRHLHKLPEKQYLLLKYFYFDKMSMKVIAEKLGYVDDKSAKVQKRKAIIALRALTIEDPDFD